MAKKIDSSNLQEKLDALRGLDFEAAETKERSEGNNAVEMTFSKSFQARLASRALNIPVEDIKELPIKEYYSITAKVANFLFSGLATEDSQSKSSEQSQ